MNRNGLKNWKDQWGRLLRAYEKIKDNDLEKRIDAKIKAGFISEKDFVSEMKKERQAYEDDLLAFFMNCFHLKDWLHNDPTVITFFKHIEGDLNKIPTLRVVQSICNRAKHFTLNETAKSKKGFRDGELKGTKLTIVSVVAKNGKGTTHSPQYDYEVEYDEHLNNDGVVKCRTTALELAKLAIEDWKEYLQQKNLKI